MRTSSSTSQAPTPVITAAACPLIEGADVYALFLCRRKYADMSSRPKYRFQHLQMDPYVSSGNTISVGLTS
jgi:hypothetical protein